MKKTTGNDPNFVTNIIMGVLCIVRLTKYGKNSPGESKPIFRNAELKHFLLFIMIIKE